MKYKRVTTVVRFWRANWLQMYSDEGRWVAISVHIWATSSLSPSPPPPPLSPTSSSSQIYVVYSRMFYEHEDSLWDSFLICLIKKNKTIIWYQHIITVINSCTCSSELDAPKHGTEPPLETLYSFSLSASSPVRYTPEVSPSAPVLTAAKANDARWIICPGGIH